MNSEKTISIQGLFEEPGKVLSDNETLENYAVSLTGTTVYPCCVVLPDSINDLQKLLVWAKNTGAALYPICKGKNWGYGSAQGTKPNQVIVELSKMDNIVEVNEQLGYVTIQPGVTQGQLSAHLEHTGSRLQMDVTAGPVTSSVLANFLERGFGHTDYGNRYNSIISLKVLLPNGQIVQTGFGAFQQKNHDRNIFRQGVGPCLDGMFLQSNLGIVLEMTLELMPKPDHFCMFAVATKHESDLGNLVEVMRELRLKGIVNSAVHITNKSRASGNEKENVTGAWSLTGSVSSEKGVAHARKKAVKKAFKKGVKGCKIHFVTDAFLNRLHWIDKNLKKLPFLHTFQFVVGLQKGIPSNRPISILLNKPNVDHIKYAKDFDGRFRWLNATCNATQTNIEKLYALVTALCDKYHYELKVTFTFITPRTLVMIANTDCSDAPEEVQKAEAFYKEGAKALVAQGFYPYRGGIGAFEGYKEGLQPEYVDLLGALKTSFDPENILAPGKYNM
ncbi:FAD-binding oxidoreductase [Microscilla marina]|uniref:D-lactate dehydrogenase (cytochrome) n=1 Tax=Microscilla marina ATCC 23134 TaxID=313606 RepID=A1ZQQ0_MICM2|nr:FAD-binding oxidoreductase [Microscilla marina]EAY27205.1 eugenol hydroxylase beta-subunit [Microscilla marina ATCC 23134]